MPHCWAFDRQPYPNRAKSFVSFIAVATLPDIAITHPYFLQDGKRFLVHVGGEKGSIQLATLGSTERTMVLDDADSAPILAPTPQGKTYLLYLQESGLFSQEFEERSGMLRGRPVLVVSDVGRVAVGCNPSCSGSFSRRNSGISDRRRIRDWPVDLV